MPKRKSTRTRSTTEGVTPVKRGSVVYMPVSTKLLNKIRAKGDQHFYWTAVDGVLQLSPNRPVMVISVLDNPEEKFEPQLD